MVRVDTAKEALACINRFTRLCVVNEDVTPLADFIANARQKVGGYVPVLVVTTVCSNEEIFKMGADSFLGVNDSSYQFIDKVDLLLGLNTVDAPADEKSNSPFERAICAAQMLADPTGNESPGWRNYRRIGASQSIKEFLVGLESELVVQQVSAPTVASDSPEGLEAIDVQGYLGHQWSVGERIELTDTSSKGEAEPVNSLTVGDNGMDEEARLKTSIEVPALSTSGDEDVGVDDDDATTEVLKRPTAFHGVVPVSAGEKTRTMRISAQPPAAGTRAVEPIPDVISPVEEKSSTRYPLSGDLHSTPIWTVLVQLWQQGVTGVLTVDSGEVVRRIYLVDGEPRMVDSDDHRDRLVELLYREGRINASQYEIVARTVGVSGRRAGVVLVDKGILATRELFPMVRYHYETLLVDTFSWRDGSWAFSAQPPTTERILLDVGLDQLIVDAFRNAPSFLNARQIVDVGASVRLRQIDESQLERLHLDRVERRILTGLERPRTVAWLAERFDLSEEVVRGFLSSLVVLGLATIGSTEDPDVDETSNARTDGVYSVIPAQARDEALLVARVKEVMALVAEGSYFDLIEMPPDAPIAELARSIELLRRFFAPERFSDPPLSDLQEQVKTIGLVLDEAAQVLLRPELNQAYRSAILDESR